MGHAFDQIFTNLIILDSVYRLQKILKLGADVVGLCLLL